jgi:hypothetical protein
MAQAGNVTSLTSGLDAPLRIFLHGRLTMSAPVPDGTHSFRIRVFSKDGGLVHSEELQAAVRGNSYDVMLGSTRPLSQPIGPDMTIMVSIDGGPDVVTGDALTSLSSNVEPQLSKALRERDENGFEAIVKHQLSVQSEERINRHRAGMASRLRSAVAMMVPYEPASGFELEMSVAPPAENIPHDPYQLAKYGRINLEYKNLATIDGNRLGLAAQALHVAHHILLYSAGISTDINNDGMFTMTAGYTHYQVGQKRDEPFVDAPFMRFKFRSSPKSVFAYSELETTMHERAYISAMLGLGMMVAPGVRFVAGFQHTEFTMPRERMVQQVNGLQGSFMWGAR